MTCAQCANCVKDFRSSWEYFSSHILFPYGFKIYISDSAGILALGTVVVKCEGSDQTDTS